MVSDVVEQVRKSVREKRQNLTRWLDTTVPSNRQARYGPADETAVRSHLHVLDRTLTQVEDPAFGICKICHDYVEPGLLEMDYTSSVCLAHFSEEEVHRLETELELSQTMQRALLPQATPAIPGLDLAVFSRPAQILGGDYFDFFEFVDGRPGLVIGDVEGHGLSSGLLMASVQAALRAMVTESDSPSQVLLHLNRFFLHNVHLTTFVTMFLGRLDQQARTLDYGNAGHNPPLVLHQHEATISSEWLMPTAAAIGLIEEFQVSPAKVSFEPGDILLLYTDGVTETENPKGEEFGRERLAELAQEAADLPAREMVHALRLTLEEFAGGQPLADDTTILACRFDNTPY